MNTKARARARTSGLACAWGRGGRALAGASVLGVLLAACGGGEPPGSVAATHTSAATGTTAPGTGPSIARLDTSGLPVKQVRPLAVVKSGFRFVFRLAVAGNQVWASSDDGLAVMDPKTTTAKRIASVAAQTSYGQGAVLVTNSFGRSVVARYDTETHKPLWEVHQEAPSGVAIEGDHLWISNYTKGTVTIADAATGKTIGSVRVSPPSNAGPSQPLLVGNKVWVRDYSTHEVIAIDAKTHVVGPRVKVPKSMKFCVKGMAASGSVLWVPDCTTLLARIDTTTGKASVVDLGAEPGTPLVLGSGAWVPLGNRLIHVADELRPDRAVSVAGTTRVFEAAHGGGALWVNEGYGTLALLSSWDEW